MNEEQRALWISRMNAERIAKGEAYVNDNEKHKPFIRSVK